MNTMLQLEEYIPVILENKHISTIMKSKYKIETFYIKTVICGLL